MISKKDILLWVCKLDDDYEALNERLTKLEKKLGKCGPKKGKKNETKK